jgi:arsenate reductase
MPAEKITIFQTPTCSMCRSVYKALLEMNIDFDSVDYCADPLSKKQLKALIGKIRISARDLLRAEEPVYQKLKLETKNFSDGKLLDFMVKYPDLIQRPIVEKGNRAILARPAERLKELFYNSRHVHLFKIDTHYAAIITSPRRRHLRRLR